jgi:hypothetical protein
LDLPPARAEIPTSALRPKTFHTLRQAIWTGCEAGRAGAISVVPAWIIPFNDLFQLK